DKLEFHVGFVLLRALCNRTGVIGKAGLTHVLDEVGVSAARSDEVSYRHTAHRRGDNATQAVRYDQVTRALTSGRDLLYRSGKTCTALNASFCELLELVGINELSTSGLVFDFFTSTATV